MTVGTNIAYGPLSLHGNNHQKLQKRAMKVDQDYDRATPTNLNESSYIKRPPGFLVCVCWRKGWGGN